jgi:Uri superfamily endonuclease
MFSEIIQTIPTHPGSYALWLHLSQNQDLTVGRLGRFTFLAGDYLYLGSAHGPGGLRARLGRHLRGDGQSHWHIDSLRAAAQVRGFGYVVQCRDTACCVPTECIWSQNLAALPGVSTPVPDFGASDCTSGCAAHLVSLPTFDPDQISLPGVDFLQTWFTVHN